MLRTLSAMMVSVRTVEELIVEDSAWPTITATLAGSESLAVALSVAPDRARQCLYRLQITTRSALGALAFHSGGIVADHGWLRLLGGGHGLLPSLADANRLPDPHGAPAPPAFLEVARDVLGGRFAVNGGGLPGDPGQICYFGPDTLQWQPLGIGHGDLVGWALAGGTTEFYEILRWPGWESEVGTLGLDQGLHCHPPLFAKEASNGDAMSRRAVPWDELAQFNETARQQLADVPDGATVRIQVIDP